MNNCTGDPWSWSMGKLVIRMAFGPLKYSSMEGGRWKSPQITRDFGMTDSCWQPSLSRMSPADLQCQDREQSTKSSSASAFCSAVISKALATNSYLHASQPHSAWAGTKGNGTCSKVSHPGGSVQNCYAMLRGGQATVPDDWFGGL